jgi:hypothetical protein
MSVTVTLHIYSGRPNPRWTLSSEQEATLGAALARGAAVTEGAVQQPRTLGYRGFTLQTASKGGLPSRAFLHGRRLNPGDGGAVRLPDHGTERWLLETAGSVVSDRARAAVLRALDRLETTPPPTTDLLGAPPYDPGVWNDDPDVMANNNCYNYANNLITNTFAQPGRGSGAVFTDFDCADVGAASERDGQVETGDPAQNPDDGQIICLVIWPDEDFHWYRKDSDDYWSHKPGSTAATNLDAAGDVIADPETCDRGEYTVLCGYYLCDPDVVTIE